MSSASTTIRVLASVGIAVVTFYGVFIGGAFSGIHSSALRSTTLVIAIVALALWAITAILQPAWRPRSRILPALLVPLAVLALTTATSRQPRLGLDYVAWSTILVALYLFLVRLMASPFYRPRMLALTTVLALIVGVWYIQEVGSRWIEWWGLVGRLTPPPLRPEFSSLTFGNPSAVMTMSILLAMPTVAWIGIASRGRAALSVLILALAASSTILSGSRAGWVGLAIAIAICGAAWLAGPENRDRVRRLPRTGRARASLGGAVLVAIVLGIALLPGFLGRFGAGGETLRGSYYQAAIRMFGESPVVGTGPGTWVAQRIAYTDVPGSDYYIPHAHNVYLQTVAELGILGAAAGFIVLFYLGGLILGAVRSQDPARAAMGWATFFSLAYFGAHQLFDVYANAPLTLVAIAIPIAWLDATGPSEVAARGKARTVARPRLHVASTQLAVVALLVTVASLWLQRSEAVAALNEVAVQAVNNGRYGDALSPAREAVDLDPAVAALQVTLGLAASHASDPAESGRAFAIAAALDDLPESWLGLAAAQAELGDVKSARVSLSRALRLGSNQPAVLVGAADLYNRIGDQAAVDRLLVATISALPGLAGDRMLVALEPDVERRRAVIDVAISNLSGSPGAVEVALATDRAGAVQDLIDILPASQRESMTLVSQAWRGDMSALRKLEDLARASPLNSAIVAWCSKLTRRSGDFAAAGRYEGWFRVIYGNTTSELRDVRTSRDAGASDSTGSTASFYGHYTYRRPTPWNLIAGSLLRLESP